MKCKVLIFGVIALANLCLAQQGTITYISPTQTKNPDENITFSCTVTKPKDTSITWLKGAVSLTLNDQVIINKSKYRAIVDEASNTYSLQILNLITGDSGKYSCRVNLDPPYTIEKEVELHVTRPPVILDMSEINVRVKEGQAATLYCNADGFPKPSIVWKRENEEIFSSKGNSKSVANLTIIQVKKEDRGQYICEVSNGIGETVSKTVLLEVDFGPIMSAKRPKVGQKEGYEAALICKVTAYPPAAVSWVRNNKELNNNEHFEIAYLGNTNEETISTLRLKSVAQHHYGDYVCKAKNVVGDGETTVELYEQEYPNLHFSQLRKSSGHRFIGFHSLYAVIGIIMFTLFH